MANQDVRDQIEQLRSARQELQRQVDMGHIKPDDPIQRYVDPIGRSIMVDPVTAEDGMVYERRNIELWIAGATGNLESPLTRKPWGGLASRV